MFSVVVRCEALGVCNSTVFDSLGKVNVQLMFREGGSSTVQGRYLEFVL